MKPSKSVYGSSEEFAKTLTTILKALNIDPKEESEDNDINFGCKEKENIKAAAIHNVYNTEKPAAVYLVNTKEWESVQRQMEEDKISYTSAKQKRDEIEIKVSDKQEHHKLLSFLLEKGIVHKTFLTRHVEEMPECMQELRRRKNKARRICQIYPSQENKRLVNSLTRIFRQELANLRFNEYENAKCLILHYPYTKQ